MQYIFKCVVTYSIVFMRQLSDILHIDKPYSQIILAGPQTPLEGP